MVIFIHLNFPLKRTYNCSDISFPNAQSVSQHKVKGNWTTSSPLYILFIIVLSD